jgi:hypothetical protein
MDGARKFIAKVNSSYAHLHVVGDLERALSGFGEMEDAVDLVRGRVGLDVVSGDDG